MEEEKEEKQDIEEGEVEFDEDPQVEIESVEELLELLANLQEYRKGKDEEQRNLEDVFEEAEFYAGMKHHDLKVHIQARGWVINELLKGVFKGGKNFIEQDKDVILELMQQFNSEEITDELEKQLGELGKRTVEYTDRHGMKRTKVSDEPDE